ncbi:MAG: porin [Bacteroidia bacterium]
MKKKYLLLLVLFVMLLANQSAKAQTTDDVLNLLLNKNLIQQEEADSIRAEFAIKQQDAKEKQKLFGINAKRPSSISGYIQTRFQSFQQAGKADAMDIRRARLDFRGTLNAFWDYRLQVDMAGVPKALDAIGTFKPYDFFKIQAGQFKIPLSMENNTPSNSMDVIERAQVVETLVARNGDVNGNFNGRDIGVMGFGSLLKKDDRFLIDYYIGGFQGEGINVLDSNEAKDLGARIILHPIKGLDIGAGYYNGYDKTGTFTPVAKNNVRTRIGGEFSYVYKIISVKGEYIYGEDGDYIKGKNGYSYIHTRREGWYAQLAAFVFQKKLQLVGRWDAYDSDIHKGGNATLNILGGVNYYFNDWAKLQVNYTSRNESGTIVNNDIIGAQLQIGF